MKIPSLEMTLEEDSSDKNLKNEESFDNDNNQLSDNDDEDDEMPEEIGLTTSRQLASKQKKAIKESLETKEAAKKEKKETARDQVKKPKEQETAQGKTKGGSTHKKTCKGSRKSTTSSSITQPHETA